MKQSPQQNITLLMLGYLKQKKKYLAENIEKHSLTMKI